MHQVWPVLLDRRWAAAAGAPNMQGYDERADSPVASPFIQFVGQLVHAMRSLRSSHSSGSQKGMSRRPPF